MGHDPMGEEPPVAGEHRDLAGRSSLTGRRRMVSTSPGQMDGSMLAPVTRNRRLAEPMQNITDQRDARPLRTGRRAC